MKTNHAFKGSSVAIAIALMSSSLSVSAQEVSETGSLELEEIIVTSQRRVASIQDVPAAITALSSADLEEKQVGDILDLQYAVPNISLATGTGTANSARIFLRGIGEDESRATAEPAIGIYVDGIYIGRSVGALFDLVDLERVEVLRGPQGTLYGRNSNGGAIRLISKAPSTEENTYFVGGTAGSDGRFDIKASANIALGENTALRASVINKTRDGFHTLNPNGDFANLAGTNVGEIDTTAFRISLAHQFNDNWAATLIVDSTQDDSDPVPDSAAPGNDADNDLFTIEPLGDTVCSSFVPAIFLPIGCFSDYRSEIESNGASLQVTGQLGDYTVTSLSGIRTLEDDLSTRIGFPFAQQTDQDQFSQEYTISSNYEGPFNFVAGAYYFTEDIQLDSTFVFPFSISVETEALAAFFESNYELSDTLTLTTGIRFTDETKDIDAAGFVPGGPLTRVESVDFSNTTFKIGLNNQFNENLMGYATFSTGFKSGGWSPDCFSPAACFLPVDEETLDSFEIGFRGDFFNDRLRLNGTYFFNVYEGLQIGATVPDLGFTRFNTNEAEINGFEFETIFRATQNLTLSATFGTISAEYTELTLQQAGGLTNSGATPACGGVVSIDCALGLDLKNAPDFKGTFGISYQQPLAGGTLTAGLDVSIEDESFSLVANDPPHAITDPGTLVDARLIYESDNNWRIAIWGKNLGDEQFARAATGGSFTQYAADPLTWGVDFGINF